MQFRFLLSICSPDLVNLRRKSWYSYCDPAQNVRVPIVSVPSLCKCTLSKNNYEKGLAEVLNLKKRINCECAFIHIYKLLFCTSNIQRHYRTRKGHEMLEGINITDRESCRGVRLRTGTLNGNKSVSQCSNHVEVKGFDGYGT